MKLFRKYIVKMVFKLETVLKSTKSDAFKGWTFCCVNHIQQSCDTREGTVINSLHYEKAKNNGSWGKPCRLGAFGAAELVGVSVTLYTVI